MRNLNLKRLNDRLDKLLNGQCLEGNIARFLPEIGEAVKQYAIEKDLTVDDLFEMALEASQGAEEGES